MQKGKIQDYESFKNEITILMGLVSNGGRLSIAKMAESLSYVRIRQSILH